MFKRKRKRMIAQLEAAASPPICPRCGEAAFFHYCKAWERDVSTDNSNRQESDRNPTRNDR